MNKKKIVYIGVFLVLLTAIIYSNTPHSVSKTLKGGIFVGDKLIKEIPVNFNGVFYNKIFDLRKVKGTLEIEGKKVEITPTRISSIATFPNHVKLKIQDMKGKQQYASSSHSIDQITGDVEIISHIYYTKDFTQFYGFTKNIREKFGDKAYFKAPKELKVIVH